MNTEAAPMEQAYELVPRRFYEKGNPHVTKLAFGLGGFAVGLSYKYFGPHIHAVTEHVAAASAYLACAITDRASSLRIAGDIEDATKAGVETGYSETSPVIGRVSSRAELKQRLNAPEIVALECSILAACALFPISAAPIVSIKGFASLNNRRASKRIRVATELSGAKSVENEI